LNTKLLSHNIRWPSPTFPVPGKNTAVHNPLNITSLVFVCKRTSVSHNTVTLMNKMFRINLSKKYVNRAKFNFFLTRVPNYAIYLRLHGVICTELRRYLRDYKSLYRFLFELKKYTLKKLGSKLCKQITIYRKHYVVIVK
jgi:hypothetical protein